MGLSKVINDNITETRGNVSVVWYNGVRKQDTGKMKRVVKQASKILGIDIDLDETCKDKVQSKAEAVTPTIH